MLILVPNKVITFVILLLVLILVPNKVITFVILISVDIGTKQSHNVQWPGVIYAEDTENLFPSLFNVFKVITFEILVLILVPNKVITFVILINVDIGTKQSHNFRNID